MPNNRWRRVKRLREQEPENLCNEISDAVMRMQKQTREAVEAMARVMDKVVKNQVKKAHEQEQRVPKQPEFVPLLATHSNPPKKKWYQRIADQVREAFHHDG